MKNKRISARRAAAFLAALGVLVMSSGVALMVAATPASADPPEGKKIVVCKYVSTPGGVLQGGNNPIEPSLSSLKNVVDDAWLANPTFPKSWGDAQGQGGGSIAIGWAGEGLDISDCPGSPPGPGAATASVTRVQATCTVAASYTTSGSHVSFTQSAAPAAGTSITVTAHADAGFLIDGTATKDFPLVFAAAPTACGSTTTVVSPPVVSTPKTPKAPKHHATTASTVTPTVVHAGLSGTTVQDVRGEQGLALMVAGMVMLVGAGGLRLRGRTSRI